MKDQKERSVLLIDDDELNLIINKQLIKEYGFSDKICIKKSCSDALAYLSKECINIDDFPDYIFLDLLMPLQNGHDFLKAYSKKNKTVKRRSKIIILSTLIDVDILQTVLKNKDIYTLLQKPLTKASLEALIDLHNIDDKFVCK